MGVCEHNGIDPFLIKRREVFTQGIAAALAAFCQIEATQQQSLASSAEHAGHKADGLAAPLCMQLQGPVTVRDRGIG